MDFFEQNLLNLKTYKTKLYEEMYENRKKEINHNIDHLDIDSALNGEAILYIHKNAQRYRLNSSYNPSHEAKIWAEQYELNNLSTIVAMFGIGNGLLAMELAKKLGKEDYLFIYEPSEQIFDFVMHHFDLTALLTTEHVIMAVEGVNDFEFHTLYQVSVNITNMFSQIQCAHPIYPDLFEKSHITFWKEIRDTLVHTRINVNSEILFGQRLIKNNLTNLKYLKDNLLLSDLKQYFNTDIPAVIIAAGPSVKENLETLRSAKGKVYSFAVDRILDYLLENGVEPDFVVTLDPMKPIEMFSKRDDITIPLFTEFASNWEVLEHHKGRKIFFNCDTYLRKMFHTLRKDAPYLITGTSVATVTFATCIELGFKRIALVGQDLAYDGDMTHAGGVAEQLAQANDVYVEGVDGKEVRSRYDWKEFITWFKDMITINPEITVIDTKKKGAKIQGTKLMPLTEVIETYGAHEINNITDIMEQLKGTLDITAYKKLVAFVKKSCDDLEALKRKSDEAMKLCDKQLKILEGNGSDNNLYLMNHKKLSKLNKFIEGKPAYSMMDSYIVSMAADEISTLYHFGEDDSLDKIDTYQKSKRIYEAIKEGVNYSLPMMKETLANLENE